MAAQKLPSQATGANIRSAIGDHADLLDAIALDLVSIISQIATKLDADQVQALIDASGGGGGSMTGAEIRAALGVTTLSGSNTGDQDLSGIITSLQGKASQADLTTLNNAYSAYVTSNNAAVAGKVSQSVYDAFVSAYNTAIALKVDKVAGKGLSTNDYTVEDKGRVDTIPALTTQVQSNTDTLASAAVVTGVFQPETLAYLAKIKAVSGGSIDFDTLSKIDKSIVEIKKVGAISKLKRLSYSSGTNLASGLVHVVGNMSNTGFLEADFTQEKGFSLTSNSGKSLDTGLIPTAEGLSNTNFSFGVMILDEQTTNAPAAILSDSPATGNSVFSFQDKSVGLGSAGAAVFGGGVEFVSASYGSNAYGFFINGYKLYGNSSTIAATLNSELKFFRGTFNGAAIYSKTSIGSYFIGEYLTDTQNKAVAISLKNFEESIGRVSTSGGKLTAEGDSNVAGKGITIPADTTASQVGKAIGFRVENLGSSGSQLRQDTSSLSAIGLFTGYRDITKTKRNMHVIMIGTNDRNIGDLTTDGNPTVISDFINKYGVIVSVFKAEGNKVVIVSPPGDASGASKVKQQAYVDACATVANSRSVVMVDIYNYMLDATATGALSELVALFLQNDNLHLSTAGHAYIVYPITLGIQGLVVRNPTFDFPEVAAGGMQELTVTMPSVRIGAQITPTYPPVTGIIFQTYCATDGVVTVRATNLTASPINPAALKINIVAKAL